jgi:hypothetical protein
VRPVGLRGLTGSYTTTGVGENAIHPHVDYVVYLTLSKSEISLDYDGSFISIVYDTSSTFDASPTTIDGITDLTYILSDPNNTTYYMKCPTY